jgi:predicted RNA methylase
MLSVFKSLRASLSSYRADNRIVVLVFNSLIKAMIGKGADAQEWETVSHVLTASSQRDAGVLESLEPFHRANVTEAIDLMSSPSLDGLRLDPYLMMRHASGHVYQEAHFELERSRFVQLRLDGSREPNKTTAGTAQRDARFTPPELARALVEQAFNHFTTLPSALTILDPACGCGIFLQEALRELEERDYSGHVSIRGYDVSDASIPIARFCLEAAAHQARSATRTVDVVITQQNALDMDVGWECRPNVVLMNPPFTRWEDLDEADKAQVDAVLGELKTGRVDKAMAFVWRAVQSLADCGVVSTVIQSPLLESTFAQKWRAALNESCILETIGRFNGYGYFPGAMVEPAFLVLGRSLANEPVRPLTALVSDTASSSLALRALRRKRPWIPEDGDGYYLDANADRSWVTPVSWVPRKLQYSRLLDCLSQNVPTVGRLFSVEQGALTGLNKVFLLSQARYNDLPPTERQWFRPFAGSPTIRDGRIHQDGFVFYPYDKTGLQLTTQDAVENALPHFFRERLKPNKADLSKRRDKSEKWWTLNWHRPFQMIRRPKICSAHFGDAGSFAFDASGEYVVVQGFAWLWTGGGSDSAFYKSDAPWAYIAILNSQVFELLLSCFCPRFQGGQFDLSRRHVDKVFIPDLIGGTVPGDIIDDLCAIGRRMSCGDSVNAEAMNELAMRAYGITPELWKPAQT